MPTVDVGTAILLLFSFSGYLLAGVIRCLSIIAPDDGSADLFAHFSAIVTDGLTSARSDPDRVREPVPTTVGADSSRRRDGVDSHTV